jgi:hypothetical protein
MSKNCQNCQNCACTKLETKEYVFDCQINKLVNYLEGTKFCMDAAVDPTKALPNLVYCQLFHYLNLLFHQW